MSAASREKATQTASSLISAVAQVRSSGNVVATPARVALESLERNADKLMSRAKKNDFSFKVAMRNVGKLESHASKLHRNMHGLFKGPIPQALKDIRALESEIRSDVNRNQLTQRDLDIFKAPNKQAAARTRMEHAILDRMEKVAAKRNAK